MTYVITIHLVKLMHLKWAISMANSFVLIGGLYVTCEKKINLFKYSFFKKMAHIICNVANDINLQYMYSYAKMNTF